MINSETEMTEAWYLSPRLNNTELLNDACIWNYFWQQKPLRWRNTHISILKLIACEQFELRCSFAPKVSLFVLVTERENTSRYFKVNSKDTKFTSIDNILLHLFLTLNMSLETVRRVFHTFIYKYCQWNRKIE